MTAEAASPALLALEDGRPAVPLAWARGFAARGRVNLGDALSPVIVAAMAGRPVRWRPFVCDAERLVAVGTIGHGQRGGVAHFWGTGFDGAVNPLDRGAPYAPPPDTDLRVHALRGPVSAGVLRRAGVAAPEIYGDPVVFIDRLFPMDGAEKTHDLGVVLHLTELEPARPFWRASPRPRPEMRRYAVPRRLRDRVRLIDTLVRPSLAAMRAKLAEIASCRAILSVSLHGLVIADAYGIPSAWFGFGACGRVEADPADPGFDLDHRVRDLYAGQARARAVAVHAPRHEAADWDRLLGLAAELAPFRPCGRALFDAFPLPRAVTLGPADWPLPHGLVEGLR